MRRSFRLVVAGFVTMFLVAGCGGTAKTLSLAEVRTVFDQRLKEAKTVRAALNVADAGAFGSLTGSLVLRDSGGAVYDIHVQSTDYQPQELEAFLTADASYIKFGAPIEPGKPWMKVAGSTSTAWAMESGLAIFRTIGDVREQMTVVAAGGRLNKTTAEHVAGVNAMRYTVTVDMEKALDEIDLAAFVRTQVRPEFLDKMKIDRADLDSPAVRTRLRMELKKQYAEVSMTVDMWVDDSGRPVKYTVSSSTSAANAGGTVEMTFSDWGKATFRLPPAEQVSDISNLKIPGL